jgi:hypothetical protein
MEVPAVLEGQAVAQLYSTQYTKLFELDECFTLFSSAPPPQANALNWGQATFFHRL